MLEAGKAYMPGTKFEMFNFDGPMDMHRIAVATLGIGIIWKTEGDAEKDPGGYTEEFEIIDRYRDKNLKGLTRRECENYVYDQYCEEIYK